VIAVGERRITSREQTDHNDARAPRLRSKTSAECGA
jgi:hypothetical protein